MSNKTFRPLAGLLVLMGAAVPAARAQTASGYVVDSEWAKLPNGGNWDGSTSWITADGRGNIVVLVRTAPYFRMFKRDGTFVKAWGEQREIASAHSLTIDRANNYWVTDSASHQVLKFNADGQLLMEMGTKGTAGDNTSRDLFNQPNHVAIAPNGDIYVSDGYVNARVVHFTPDGKFVRIIGGDKGSAPGQLQLPHGVALDSRGRILINDSDNARVSVFDKDGKFVETWPYPSRGGLEVAADDTVYVSDVNQGVINVSRDGKHITTYEAPRPHGLGVDTDGSVYASGASRMTVMKIVAAQGSRAAAANLSPANLSSDDRAAIQALTARYAQALGACRAAEFADLFVPETGAFASGFRGRLVGRERLIALVESERHCVAPNGKGAARPGGPGGPEVAIEVTASGVRGVANLGTAEYQDEYTKTPQGWRFASRTVIVAAEKAAGLDASAMLAIQRLGGAKLGDYYEPDQNGVARLMTSGVRIGISNGQVTGRAFLKQGGYDEEVYERATSGEWRVKSSTRVPVAR